MNDNRPITQSQSDLPTPITLEGALVLNTEEFQVVSALVKALNAIIKDNYNPPLGGVLFTYFVLVADLRVHESVQKAFTDTGINEITNKMLLVLQTRFNSSSFRDFEIPFINSEKIEVRQVDR